MGARSEPRRFTGVTPLAYQGIAYALSNVPAFLTTAVVLYAGLRSHAIAGRPGLATFDTAAALAGIVASLVGNSILAFRSGVLFRGPALRRFMLANLFGMLVQVAAFVALAGTRVTTEEFDLPAVTGMLMLPCALQYTATFVVLHIWGYRLEPMHPVARPMDLSYAAPVFDVELMSIAGGERVAQGLWARRAWIGAYFGVLGACIVYGWIGVVGMGMSTGDGGARVMQAFQVVFGRHPHLGALGFVWPPIPSLSDVPFLLFAQPLGQPFFAGTVMGSLYAAGAVLLFYALLRQLHAGRALALLLSLALLLNEQFLQTSVAGLSEPVLAFFLLASLLAFVKWLRDPQSGLVAIAGVATGGAILCRYEAAFWAAAMGLAIFIVLYGGVPGFRFFRDARAERDHGMAPAWNNLLAFGVPSGFALGVWMYLSLQTVGSPFYFLTGSGSTKQSPDTAALAGPDLAGYGPQGTLVYHAYHSLAGTVSMVLDRVGYFSPLLLVFTLVLLVHALRRRDARSLAVVGVAWSIPAFGVITGYLGSLPPYGRYWYWVAPMGVVTAVYAMSLSHNRNMRVLLAPIVVAVAFMPVLRTFLITYQSFDAQHPTTAQRWQNAVFTNTDFGSVPTRQEAVTEWKDVAAAVDRTVAPHQTVLFDVSSGGAIVLYVRHPEQFVTSTDQDFRSQMLGAPWKYGDFVLAPEPTFDVVTRSLLFLQWPKIWSAGYPWLAQDVEVPSIHKWRLLAVTGAPPPDVPADGPATGGATGSAATATPGANATAAPSPAPSPAAR